MRGFAQELQRSRETSDVGSYLETIQNINQLIGNLSALFRRLQDRWKARGTPVEVVRLIVEEGYNRSVALSVKQLGQYGAFSSQVYGELMPSFVAEIIHVTELHRGSVFLDLGSGVGNVVLQVSVQVGCCSFGIELREDLAGIATKYLQAVQSRCSMWGATMGAAELWQGDFTSDPRLDQLLPCADVIVVNNLTFPETCKHSSLFKYCSVSHAISE